MPYVLKLWLSHISSDRADKKAAAIEGLYKICRAPPQGRARLKPPS
jgi:hypothetical protein